MSTLHITEDEYVEANLLFSQITLRRALGYAIACSAVLAGAFALRATGYQVPILLVLFASLGGCIGSELGRFICVPIKARKLYRQHQAFHEPIEFSWNDSGVSLTAATGSSTTPWEHYRKYREGRAMFILFLTDNLYHMVPHTAFSGRSELDAFRAVVDARVGT